MKLKLYAIGIWYFIVTHITEFVILLSTISLLVLMIAWAITGLEALELISGVVMLVLIVATVKFVLSRDVEEE